MENFGESVEDRGGWGDRGRELETGRGFCRLGEGVGDRRRVWETGGGWGDRGSVTYWEGVGGIGMMWEPL